MHYLGLSILYTGEGYKLYETEKKTFIEQRKNIAYAFLWKNEIIYLHVCITKPILMKHKEWYICIYKAQ